MTHGYTIVCYWYYFHIIGSTLSICVEVTNHCHIAGDTMRPKIRRHASQHATHGVFYCRQFRICSRIGLHSMNADNRPTTALNHVRYACNGHAKATIQCDRSMFNVIVKGII